MDWKITTFEVTVKHRPIELPKHIAMDIKHALSQTDMIKSVKVRKQVNITDITMKKLLKLAKNNMYGVNAVRSDSK